MNSDLEMIMADLNKHAQEPCMGCYRWFLVYTNSLSGYDSQKSDLRKRIMPRMVQVVRRKKKKVPHSIFHNPLQSTTFNWAPAILFQENNILLYFKYCSCIRFTAKIEGQFQLNSDKENPTA
jgi:hypothetical protein